MKRLFITGLALCIGLLTFAQEAVDFRLTPEIGKPLNINMLLKTDVEGPQDVIMDMNMKMEMTPASKEGENYTIESAVRQIKVDLNAGMMTLSYDSEVESTDPTAQMLGAEFSKLLNQKITSVVTEKGKTVDISLPAEFSSQGFDPNSFANMSPSFPDKAVTPGESWESISEIPDHPLLSKVEMLSTYREKNAEGYVIDVKGKVLDASGNEVGTIVGDYTLDQDTHYTKSSNLKTTIETQGAKIVSEVEMNVIAE